MNWGEGLNEEEEDENDEEFKMFQQIMQKIQLKTAENQQ